MKVSVLTAGISSIEFKKSENTLKLSASISSEQADMPAAEITEIVLEYERCAV
ncbi:hypothetical protein IQ269_00450 [Tychonema sp. LEGE 07199]|uniref:hypothetical protein n=1 Tax=unclassified Tychonema TaxID=2642144 RepID=UPI00187EA832|nr:MULTISPECIES: hypothetical protein [unclassified Tychonema]MBE9119311.1 hypothetical protein [Tychonema sp. LEGE 07199]MBE9130866.1 hypothetical protein [Tychonema sp. LEGE 07196]